MGDDAADPTTSGILRALADDFRELRELVKLQVLLTMPPRGTKIEARLTSSAWDNFTLPAWVASWTLQNQSAAENVRYAYTRVEQGGTYWLIYPQGNVSRASSPDQVFFTRDGAGASPPTVALEVNYWTEEQIEQVWPKARTVVGKAAQRRGLLPQPR